MSALEAIENLIAILEKQNNSVNDEFFSAHSSSVELDSTKQTAVNCGYYSYHTLYGSIDIE